MCSTASMFIEHNIWLQDVTQPYIRGHDLQRDVHIKPAAQLNLAQNTYLKLLKPLWGLSESRDSWFRKYKELLEKQLKLQATNGALSFHNKIDNNGKLKGAMDVYVDDKLASGHADFEKLTENATEDI